MRAVDTPIFPRESRALLHRWVAPLPALARRQASFFALALFIHASLLAILIALPKPKKEEGAGSGTTVKITLDPPSAGRASAPSAPADNIQPAPETQKPVEKKSSPPAPSPRTARKRAVAPNARDFGVQQGNTGVAIPVAPAPDAQATPRAGAADAAPRAQANEPVESYGPSGVSKGTRKLLPGADRGYLDDQRRMGNVIGGGPVAGDLPDATPNPDADVANRPVIVENEYTYAAYYDQLSRRFAEAWGGTRTLPPDAIFNGTAGEFIDYDIVINKDGTLRKIVNVSQRKQPHRDFKAVDELVTGVFQTIFPLPLPERFNIDPLVVRKRIQFVGYRYRML